MQLRDISTDTETTYQLKENEQVVFFMWNRSGNMAFELTGPQAAAHVFAFFIGKKQDVATLNISQKHLARKTTSRVLVKSVLHDHSQFSYRGVLHITKDAPLSDASQENRNLILSREAKAASEPILEILNNDVRCHHASTTSPLNEEQISFLESRGLTRDVAKKLLVNGFLRSSIEAMGELISSHDRDKMVALIEKSLE